MSWLKLTLRVDQHQAPPLADALEEWGATSVTLQDASDEPIFETQWDQTPLWSQVQISALFPEHTDTDHILLQVRELFGLSDTPAHNIEPVGDQDWAHAWKEKYRPIHMGGALWVCPSWCEPPDKTAVNIVLDPGMAFGTGDHPTTALCLEWLAEQALQDKVVLDYGCGSGILAIAALRLGAREAYAVDIDDQSLTVTRENAERNGVAERLRIMQPSNLPATLSADFLVANILAGALIELAPTLIARTKPGTGLALSGLLTEQAPEIRTHYAPPFNLATRERVGWAALAGSRP